MFIHHMVEGTLSLEPLIGLSQLIPNILSIRLTNRLYSSCDAVDFIGALEMT